MMVLLRLIGLFTIFHVGNWNQQVGRVFLWYNVQLFVVAWWHFHLGRWEP